MTYIVVWTIKLDEYSFRDDYKVFLQDEYKKPKKAAKKFYKRLLKEDYVYTASVTKVIESTDY